MRYLGARVILTPASEKGQRHDRQGARPRREARLIPLPAVRERGQRRHAQPDHGRGDPRRLRRGLDYWVTGFGTGGTLKGVARVLRKRSPGTRIVRVEPDTSQLLSNGIAQTYMARGGPAASHPHFRPHPMQGWSPDFIPKLANDVLQDGMIDQLVPGAGADALAQARILARREGIFCGITGGATFAAALEIARTAPRGTRILAMIPDTGERYLSTALFEHVAESMNDDELAIASSTPSARFDAARRWRRPPRRCPSRPRRRSGSSRRPSPIRTRQ